MAAGRVSDEELNSGLFFFGCMRGHALDPAGDGLPNNDATWPFGRKWNRKAKANHRRLRRAVLKAEKTTPKRVAYRKVRYNEKGSVSRLNTLLERNGLKPLHFPGEELPSYPETKELITAENPSVAVVWCS